MKVGGVELRDGKIVELIVESVSTAPSFSADEIGSFYFSIDDGILRFNNGERLFPLNSTATENPNLVESLGSNWLTNDLTFNPEPFNNLAVITGLTSNDSLFNVIEQLATAVGSVTDIPLEDISVPDGIQDMTIVTHLSGDLVLLTIDQILQGTDLKISIRNIDGFDIDNTDEGNILSFNNEGELVSKKVSHTYTSFTANDVHSITHNLGSQFCSVFCINPSTKKSVTPVEIEYVTENQLTVTLGVAGPLLALVSKLP